MSYTEYSVTNSNSTTTTTTQDVDQKRKSLTVRGLTGLKNMGNTCYMNSILQCLSSIDMFRSWILSTKFEDFLKKNKRRELKKKTGLSNKEAKFQQLFDEACTNSVIFKIYQLFEVMWEKNVTVTPQSFKAIISAKFPSFQGYGQNDSQELLHFILDGIHDEIKTHVKIKFPNMTDGVKEIMKQKTIYQEKIEKSTNLEEKNKLYLEFNILTKNNKIDYANFQAYVYWHNQIKNSFSIITYLFTGLYYSEVTCDICQNESGSFESFTMIQLPTKDDGETSLEACMQEFSNSEKLTGSEQYFCQFCNKHVDANKKIYFWEAPEILIVHLKRFKTEKNISSKTTSVVKFPIYNLDITEFFSKKKSSQNPNQKILYNLKAISDHKGTCNYGHYISYCRNNINNKWYEFNDENIFHIPDDELEKELITKNAYILFYVKN